MVKKTSTKATPTPTSFPLLGEIVRELYVLLDLGRGESNDGRRKDLDRFAKEIHFDVTVARKYFDDKFYEPLAQKIGRRFADLVTGDLNAILSGYVQAILVWPVNFLERSDVLPHMPTLLMSGDFLAQLAEKFRGPPLEKLLSTDSSVVGDVLDWAELQMQAWGSQQSLSERWVASKVNENGTRDDEKAAALTLRKWRSGEPLSLDSIATLTEAICKDLVGGLRKIDDLRECIAVWLTISSVLIRAERKLPELRKLLLSQVRDSEANMLSAIAALVQQNDLAAEQPNMHDFYQLEQKIIDIAHRETPEKSIDIEVNVAKDIILKLRQVVAAKKLPKPVMTPALLGNAHILHRAKRFKLALKMYTEAFDFAAYNGGDAQERLLRYVLVLAARLGDKRTVNRYWKVSAGLGLFGGELMAPDQGAMEQLARAYQGIFPGAPEPGTHSPTAPVTCFTYDQFKPDFSKPRKSITINGLKRPQLFWAIICQQLDTVNKLIEQSPTGERHIVNQLSPRNESALAIALGDRVEPGDKTMVDALMQVPHSADVINARSEIKKFSALEKAIDVGNVAVVKQLLAWGANPNIGCSIENMPALYFALRGCVKLSESLPKSFAESRKLGRTGEHQRYLNSFMSQAGAVFDKDYDQQFDVFQENDDTKQISEILSKVWFEQDEERFDIDARREIVKLLLDKGADPNGIAHVNGLPFSVMAYAAEVGDVEVFRELEKHGGKRDNFPLEFIKVNRTTTCAQIAIAHGKQEMAAFLMGDDH